MLKYGAIICLLSAHVALASSGQPDETHFVGNENFTVGGPENVIPQVLTRSIELRRQYEQEILGRSLRDTEEKIIITVHQRSNQPTSVLVSGRGFHFSGHHRIWLNPKSEPELSSILEESIQTIFLAIKERDDRLGIWTGPLDPVDIESAANENVMVNVNTGAQFARRILDETERLREKLSLEIFGRRLEPTEHYFILSAKISYARGEEGSLVVPSGPGFRFSGAHRIWIYTALDEEKLIEYLETAMRDLYQKAKDSHIVE